MTIVPQVPREWAGGRMLSHVEGRVGIVTFNQPEKRNAVSTAMWDALREIIEMFASDDRIRVVMLMGAGGEAFVSGADISEFDKARSNEDAAAQYEKRSLAARKAIRQMSKPTVACIEGFCLGAGIAIAACCDLRVAASNSRFGIPAARLGIAYGLEDVRQLVAIVGNANARALLLTGERIDCAEALRIGFLSRISESGNVRADALKLAMSLSENAPLSMSAAKAGLDLLARGPVGVEEFEIMKSWQVRCVESRDYREGRTAFMQKRKPAFEGR